MTRDEWEIVRWEGGPHDGLIQGFKGQMRREWRTCECHKVAYRYVGIVDGAHLLVVETTRVGQDALIEATV